MSEFYSVVQYVGSAGGDTDFTIPFPYLRNDHIYLFRSDIGIARPGSWDYLSPSMVRLATPLAENEVLTVRRFTFKDTRLAEYHDGSILTELELNDVSRQLLYLIQEIADYRKIQEDGGPVPGGDGSDPLPESEIDRIIERLLNTQLIQDLTTLIDLVDINAESVMAGIVSTHQEWSIGALHDQAIARADTLIDQYGVELGDHDARVNVVENEVIGPDSALAQYIVSLGAAYNGNQSNIVQLSQAITNDTLSKAEQVLVLKTDFEESNSTIVQQLKTYADSESATATNLTALDVSLWGANGWITTIGSLKVDADHVTARLQEELGVTWVTEGSEAAFQESMYLSGVKATAEDGVSRIDAAESFLVSTSNAPLFQEPVGGWDPNSFVGTVSGLVTEVDGISTDSETSISFVRSMASLFGGSEDNTGAIASAIKTDLETYADSESATARRVDTYMAQTAPVFFSDTPPDITVLPWSDSEYYNYGFPEGASWFKHTTTATGAVVLKSFIWVPGRLNTVLPTSFAGLDDTSSGTDWFYNAGRYHSTLGYIGRGVWVNKDATAIGGVIQSIADVSVNPDGSVSTMLHDLVQAVAGDEVAAVDVKIENLIDPQTGLMNSQYMVRANQYVDGQPVIAGFGLGLQQDPTNPDAGSISNFAVMADYFSVMAAPAGDALTDPVDVLDLVVPFVVDSTGRVFVNGDLFVEDNLFAYSGRMNQTFMGRAVFGQQTSSPTTYDGNWQNLIDPNGFRLELLSSTDGYWVGPTRNYLMWAGTGNRNDNNAVFWLDSDGNAFFGGQVQAENINGSLSNVDFQHVNANVSVNKFVSAWSDVGPVKTFTIDSLRLLRVVIQASVKMLNSKTGSFRLMARYENDNGIWSSWEEIDKATRDMDRLYYENEVQLWGTPGVLSNGTGQQVNIRNRVEYQVQMSNPGGRDGSPSVTTDGYKAMIMALPTSSTPAATTGSETTDTSDDTGTSTGGDGAPPPGGSDPTGSGVSIQ